MKELPKDIADAIESLRDAEHRHGAAYFSGGANEHRLERLADKEAQALEDAILAHLGRAALSDNRSQRKGE